MKGGNLARTIMLEASKRGHRLFLNARGRGWVGGRQTVRNGVVTIVGGSQVTFGVGPDGAADLIGWTKDGRMAAIEVKADGDKIRDGQPEFIQAVRNAGGRAGFAYTVADAIAILEPS